MSKGQLTGEWLLSAFSLLVAISILASSVSHFSSLSSSALARAGEMRVLAAQSIALHSQMFISSNARIGAQNLSAGVSCIRRPNGSFCQPMARGVYVDRGVLKYEGVLSNEPV